MVMKKGRRVGMGKAVDPERSRAMMGNKNRSGGGAHGSLAKPKPPGPGGAARIGVAGQLLGGPMGSMVAGAINQTRNNNTTRRGQKAAAISGAVTGAIGGAAVGAKYGLVAGGTRGAVIGGVGGAAVGGAVGAGTNALGHRTGAFLATTKNNPYIAKTKKPRKKK